VNHLHIAILQDLLPLRGGFISEEVVFIPKRVSSSDESEDRMRIDIVGVRKPISKDNGLEGQDMVPTGFCLKENGIKHESAIVIQRSDEVPFFLRGGCPEVMGGIMLNEFSGITG
jgi:hypothetical protein